MPAPCFFASLEKEHSSGTCLAGKARRAEVVVGGEDEPMGVVNWYGSVCVLLGGRPWSPFFVLIFISFSLCCCCKELDPCRDVGWKLPAATLRHAGSDPIGKEGQKQSCQHKHAHVRGVPLSGELMIRAT